MTVLAPEKAYEVTVPVVVVGAGAAGLCAALAAHEAGAEVLVLERDPVPRGSTATTPASRSARSWFETAGCEMPNSPCTTAPSAPAACAPSASTSTSWRAPTRSPTPRTWSTR